MEGLLDIIKELINKSINESEELKLIENEITASEITASLLKTSIAASAEVYKYNKEHPNKDRDDTITSLVCATILMRSLNNALEAQINVVNNLLTKYLCALEKNKED